jgi:hypothetical protein
MARGPEHILPRQRRPHPLGCARRLGRADVTARREAPLMPIPEAKLPFAWQPLTPRGAAAFAGASLGRLLGVQLVFALLAAAAAVWFLHANWFPAISEAIRRLPAQGEIRSGRLEWAGGAAQELAERHFLSVTVDPGHTGGARTPAHVQVEFGRNEVQVFSLLGFIELSYPRGATVPFNREQLEPWWGAWAPWILAIVAGLVTGGLMLVWAVLATLYCLPVWLIGFYGNRQLSLGGSWRVAGAALMPGALLVTVATVVYGLGGWDLVRLAAAWGAHLVVGWCYLAASPFWVPLQPEAARARGNPFAGAGRPGPKPQDEKRAE